MSPAAHIIATTVSDMLCTVIGSIDNFDEECIRKEILSFFERRELPTIDLLLKKVGEPLVNYCGGGATLENYQETWVQVQESDKW